jgi:hypothetical protein
MLNSRKDWLVHVDHRAHAGKRVSVAIKVSRATEVLKAIVANAASKVIRV